MFMIFIIMDSVFNRIKIHEEFKTPRFANFSIAYLQKFNIAMDRGMNTIYFLDGQPDSGMTKIGLLLTLEPLIIEHAANNSDLSSLLTFDQASDKDLQIPYGIFVKKGELFVSDSRPRVNGVLCGFYSEELLTVEQAQAIRIQYMKTGKRN